MSGHGTLLERTPRQAPRDPEWVRRFGVTERFAHWWTVSMVAVALLTGLAMGDDESRSGVLVTVHWGSVALLGAGLLAAAVVGDTRALLRAAWRLFTPDRYDLAWVRDHLRHPFGVRGGAHRYGMFNPAQKALAWALTVAVGAVVYTGVQALATHGGEDSGGPHGAAVAVAMVLVGLHVFMAVLNPATNPALRGMLTGRVRRTWAARHHGAWLEEQERRR